MKPQIARILRKLAIATSFNGRLPIAQKILRRAFKGAKGIVQVEDFDRNLTIDLSLSEHMQSRIFWVGYYNQEIVSLLDKLLLEEMVFIDVGANIGELTMVASRRVGPHGRVISFEPVSSNLLILTKNLDSNSLANTKIVAKGLSDRQGTAYMYQACVQTETSEENLGLNSLYAGTGDGVPIQSIPLTTLDLFLEENPLERVDFIKIDVEGAELPCLKGAEQTLRRFKPTLIVEVQNTSSAAAGYDQGEILRFLEPLGYTFFHIGRRGTLISIQPKDLMDYQNVLCVHSATPESR